MTNPENVDNPAVADDAEPSEALSTEQFAAGDAPDQADASGEDAQVEQTDNGTTEEDGPQDDVDQGPVSEDEIDAEDA